MQYKYFLVFCVSWCLFSVAALAQNATYFPPNFGTWETVSTDALNWCQPELDDLHNFLSEKNTKAFIILKDGRIALEWYYGTFTQDSVWYWASAGKTLTATLVGIAQEEGLLSIDNPVQDYLGQGWTNTTAEQESQITIRHQLTMTSGLDDSNFSCTSPACLTYLAAPGSRWSYHNAPYTLLTSVIESASEQSINNYYYSKIASKIGSLGTYVTTGFNRVFFSKARSMARFGLLMYSGGNWNESTVLGDMDYFNAMTTPSQNINPAYGYLWWLNGQSSYMLPGTQFSFDGPLVETAPSDLYAALGKDDQKIYIVPSLGLVVIRMGEAADGSPLALSDFEPLLWAKIMALACTTNTGEARINEASVTLFPNPANDRVWVRSDEQIERLVLYNAAGMELRQTTENHLSIASLPSAVYFIIVHTKERTYSKKIIKM